VNFIRALSEVSSNVWAALLIGVAVGRAAGCIPGESFKRLGPDRTDQF